MAGFASTSSSSSSSTRPPPTFDFPARLRAIRARNGHFQCVGIRPVFSEKYTWEQCLQVPMEITVLSGKGAHEKPSQYNLTFGPTDEPTCTCEDHIYRRRRCKHIMFIMYRLYPAAEDKQLAEAPVRDIWTCFLKWRENQARRHNHYIWPYYAPKSPDLPLFTMGTRHGVPMVPVPSAPSSSPEKTHSFASASASPFPTAVAIPLPIVSPPVYQPPPVTPYSAIPPFPDFVYVPHVTIDYATQVANYTYQRNVYMQKVQEQLQHLHHQQEYAKAIAMQQYQYQLQQYQHYYQQQLLLQRQHQQQEDVKKLPPPLPIPIVDTSSSSSSLSSSSSTSSPSPQVSTLLPASPTSPASPPPATSSSDSKSSEDTVVECPICFEPLQASEIMWNCTTEQCTPIHYECIKASYTYGNKTCPLCRADIQVS